MKHIRDPVTGRCAVCESNGVDPSVLHNGIFYPESNAQKPSPRPQRVNVQEDSFQPSPRPQRHAPVENSLLYPRYGGGNPGKPSSVTTQSVTSTASASQVTFATQTSFVEDGSPTASPSAPRRERRHRDEYPRYSPEGSPSRMRNSDSRFKEPQVWFVGESQGRTRRSPSPVRREKRRSPSPERKRKPRERTPSPDSRMRDNDDRWRRDRHSYDKASNRNTRYYSNRSYTGHQGYNKSAGRRSCCRSCSRGCRRWCTCRRCCMIFWITLLILLALAALATAIYFAVAGAANESSVTDVTLLKDPRYLIYGVDQPCRTTVITDPTTTVPVTTPTTDTTSETTTTTTTTTTTAPTTTLILCYDTTTSIVRSGNEFRNEAGSLGVTSSLMLCLAVTVGFLTRNFLGRI